MSKARPKGQRSLAALALQVENPEQLAAFYCTALGMKRLERGGEVCVGYGQGASLVLRPSPQGAYQHHPDDRYWKISITVPDLDVAHQALKQKGVVATPPHQFREIAYMSHLADPEGHVIELLQHTFEGKSRTVAGDPAKPLGGGAQIGLITLRTSDIEAELAHCEAELGMAYLSRQAVSDRGFDLYFVAFTDETRPDPDVNGVENREWLWQRPYTSLEFQHRLDGGPVRRTEAPARGAATVLIEAGDETLSFS